MHMHWSAAIKFLKLIREEILKNSTCQIYISIQSQIIENNKKDFEEIIIFVFGKSRQMIKIYVWHPC